MISRSILHRLRIRPGTSVRLKSYDPSWGGVGELESLGKDELEQGARDFVQKSLRELRRQQELLYASGSWSVLAIFQAMDAAGKDGAIEHVFSGVNPQGCQVTSFKQPSAEEMGHDFLWRVSKALPEDGRIGIFNRSHYEEVLVVRVHPELIERQNLPIVPRGKRLWRERYDDINRFERHLARNGTLIVKFFLHLSKAEQKRRFVARLDDPEKHWKFSAADVAEREHWSAYRKAYEEAISATSTKWAPWYIVPADRKWLTRALVAGILTESIRSLRLRTPETTTEQRRALSAARRRLESE